MFYCNTFVRFYIEYVGHIYSLQSNMWLTSKPKQ